jgi:hypothetical protein
MSARANPYHNAWTESFMGTLKSEMLQDGCFMNDRDARTEIFDYIESYYKSQALRPRLPVVHEGEFGLGAGFPAECLKARELHASFLVCLLALPVASFFTSASKTLT